MPEKTKAELEHENDVLRQQLAEIAEKLAERDVVARGSGEPGWLVSTRNPFYDGVTAGVQFIGGKAFIPAKTVGGEHLARRMASDFGYQVEDANSSVVDKLPKKVEKEKTYLEKVSLPSVMK